MTQRAETIRLSFLVLLVACTPMEGPPAPQTVDAPVRTDRARYTFQNGPFGLETTIVATFRAPTTQTVYVMNCNGAITTGLQRLVENRWIDAWIAMTNSCLSPPIEIPPGAVRTERIVIRPGPVVYPPNKEQIESGAYRVVWHNVLTSFDLDSRPYGEDLPLEQRVSAPFTIEVPAVAAVVPKDGA